MKNTGAISSTIQRKFKVAVVGCGNVGATAAYAMLIDGSPTEIVLIDRDAKKAEGIALDFQHALPFVSSTIVTSDTDAEACRDADLVVITAGVGQKTGQTRLDLLAKNRAIMSELIPHVAQVAPESILLMVTNPVDILTYDAVQLSGFPAHRVFGTGTMLDTARLRYHIGKRLCVNPRSVHAFVLGEHGDSAFPVYSSANIAGKPLRDFDAFTPDVAEQCFNETRTAAYRIIQDMGFTCYAIGLVVRDIMKHIFHDNRVVVPLSVKLKNYYGHSDIALSVPCVLGGNGIEEILTVPLDDHEQQLLTQSADAMRTLIKR